MMSMLEMSWSCKLCKFRLSVFPLYFIRAHHGGHGNVSSFLHGNIDANEVDKRNTTRVSVHTRKPEHLHMFICSYDLTPTAVLPLTGLVPRERGPLQQASRKTAP
jgi:hypothetical protein